MPEDETQGDPVSPPEPGPEVPRPAAPGTDPAAPGTGPAVAGADSGSASRRTPSSKANKSFSDLINEFAGMVITYVKQETIDPIKALGRYLGFGFAAAILISTGWIVLAVAVIRLLQAETSPHLEGSLSWIPYIGGVLTALAGVLWAVSRISKEQK
jgi:hypothetical protein